jgi:hypothetical protein
VPLHPDIDLEQLSDLIVGSGFCRDVICDQRSSAAPTDRFTSLYVSRRS